MDFKSLRKEKSLENNVVKLQSISIGWIMPTSVKWRQM
jgi:hypothetical protein